MGGRGKSEGEMSLGADEQLELLLSSNSDSSEDIKDDGHTEN